MTEQITSKKLPMPPATIEVKCDLCGRTFATLPISTNYLAAVIFRLRKQHARDHHDWQEAQ